jgi:antitoxin-like ribbon-helix-helix protein
LPLATLASSSPDPPFADPPQPPRVGKKSATVYLPENIWRDLKILAATPDSTINALMRRGIDLVLA